MKSSFINDGDFNAGTKAGRVIVLLHHTLLFVVCLMFLGHASAAGVNDFENKIAKINEDASLQLGRNGFEEIAELQDKRNELAQRQWVEDPQTESVWVKAEDALFKVNGQSGSGNIDDIKPGLVEQCRYKEAVDLLEKTWTSFDRQSNKYLPGHVATRIYEVVEQSKGVLAGVLDETSPNFLIAEAKMKQYLEEARQSDPCCLIATPMLLMLDKGDPSEVFLRAEVRESFKTRQKELSSLGHPASFVDGGTIEGDKRISEWQAPVELCKANSLKQLLSDLDYGKVIAGGLERSPTGTVYPKSVLMMKDASSTPIALIYGFVLIHKVRDSKGRTRTAVTLLDEQVRDGEWAWETHYLELLWKHPDGDNSEEKFSKTDRVLSRFPELFNFEIGKTKYSIISPPIAATQDLIKMDPKRLLIKDIFRFRNKLKSQHSPTFASTKFFKYEMQNKTDLRRTFFRSTPQLLEEIEILEKKNDRTTHAISNLMDEGRNNPVLLLSKYDGKSLTFGQEPNFLTDENGQKYLDIPDGLDSKLYFEEEAENEMARFVIRKGESVIWMPLTWKSIDSTVLMTTPIGQVMSSLLDMAGYNAEEKEAQVQSIMDTLHKGSKMLWPIKYKRLAAVKGRVVAYGPGGSLLPGHEQLCREVMSDLFGWTPTVVSSTFYSLNLFAFYDYWSDNVKVGSYVSSETVSQDVPCLDSLKMPYEMFTEYGFRNLRDPRNRIILSRGLTSSYFVEGQQGQQGQQEETFTQRLNNAEEYPFDIWEQDGSKRVPLDQIYSWEEYEEIKDSIYYEHLSKMTMLHPSPAALYIIENDSRDPIVNPFETGLTALASTSDPQGNSQAGGGQELLQTLRTPAFVDLNNYVQGAELAGKLNEGFNEAINTLSQNYADIYKDLASASYLLAGLQGEWLRARETTALIGGLERQVKWNDALGSGREELGQELGKMREAAKQQEDFAAERFRSELEKLSEARRILKAVLHTTARDLYDQGFYHRSIIFYNDIIKLFDKKMTLRARDVFGDSAFRFFLDVATSEKAQDFIDKVAGLIQNQIYDIQLQLELAKVLGKTEFKDSALYLLSHVEDSYEWCLAPAIKLSEGFVTAYGLSFSQRMKQALVRLEDAIEAARNLRNQLNQEIEWREANVTPGPVEFQANLKLVESGLKKEDADVAVTEKLMETLAGKRLSIVDWLAAKKTLAPKPELFSRGSFLISPLDFCPQVYDPEDGFEARPIDLVSQLPTDELIAYCRGNEPQSVETKLACIFLLAWYWLDSNQPEPSKARAAFIEAVKVCRDAQEKGRGQESFVFEYQKFRMFLGASACLEVLPGVSQIKTEFSEGLVAQIYDWQKRWFADGFDPSHATGARLNCEIQLSSIYEAKERAGNSFMNDRYYFPDYRFWRDGVVPDTILVRLIDRRQKELSELAAKALEQNKTGKAEASPPELDINWFKDGGPSAFWDTFALPLDFDFITE